MRLLLHHFTRRLRPGAGLTPTGFWLAAGLLLVCLQPAIYWLSGQFEYGTPLASRPIRTFVALQVGAGFVYLIALTQLRAAKRTRLLLIWVLIIGGLMRLFAWAGQPILEDDYYRYLWDGAVTASGVNPYRYSPAEVRAGGIAIPETIRLEALHGSEILERVNHPWFSTIYPPVTQFAFAAAHAAWPWRLAGWRVVLLVVDVISLLLLLALLRAFKLPQLYIAIYWWNPILVKEVFNSGHMDLLMAPWLLAAVLFFRRDRPLLAGGFLAIATGVKIWPVLLLPIFMAPWLNRRRELLKAVAVYVGIASLFAIPMVQGTSASSGLLAYSSNWEMNDAFFMALTKTALLLPGLSDAKALFLVKILLGLALTTLALVTARRVSRNPALLLPALVTVIAALVLVSPTQFPWYFLWLLPLLALKPVWPLLAMTATLPLYYLRFYFLSVDEVHYFDNVIVWLEWAPIWFALVIWLFSRTRAQVPASREAEIRTGGSCYG